MGLFIYTQTWECNLLNNKKEKESLAQTVLRHFLSVFALQYSLCNLQLLKSLPDSVAVHLYLRNSVCCFSALLVIQVMHINTYL